MPGKRAKKPDVKLVALDFDLTIYDHADPRRTRDLQRWFLWLASRGVYVGLASGRTIQELRKPLIEVGVPWASPFPHFVVCNEGQIVTPNGEDWPGAESWNLSRRVIITRANELLRPHFVFLTDWANDQNIPITRPIVASEAGINLVLDTPASAQRVLEVLEDRLGGSKDYHLGRNHHIVLAVPHNLDKGAAVAHLAELHNLKPDQVLAIGDNLNDRTMLGPERGFRAAAPSNADPTIARLVTDRGGIVASNPISAGVADIFTRTFGGARLAATAATV